MDDDALQDRLDRLESLLEKQQETIAAQRERIAALERQGTNSGGRLVADGTSVKVLGELDADDATGVLGRATGSGQTYGVRGEAPSTSGYGLSTPDDAQVDGTAELAAVGGAVTGGTTVTDLLGTGLAVDGGAIAVVSRPSPSSPGDGSPVSKLLDTMPGSGTSSDPYVITTDQELQAMDADRSANYVLGRDINASLTGQWNSANGFDPIGDVSNAFTGTFDGRGHTITGLTIDRPSTSFVGLFAQMDSGATVENVRLADADVTGESAVGGLAGFNLGTVERVAVGGSVAGNSSSGGDVGGIVGRTDGVFRQSIATASVGAFDTVGGLLGQNNGSVELSIAAAAVSGDTDVGAIVGQNNSSATTQDAYWDTNETGQAAIGNNSGTSSDLTGLPTADLQGSSAATNLSLLDFNSVWTTRPSDYPIPQVLAD